MDAKIRKLFELLIIMIIGISQMQHNCADFEVGHADELNFFFTMLMMIHDGVLLLLGERACCVQVRLNVQHVRDDHGYLYQLNTCQEHKLINQLIK